MSSLLKSSFLRRFAGGFVLGMIGVVSLQPAAAGHFVDTHIVHPAR